MTGETPKYPLRQRHGMALNHGDDSNNRTNPPVSEHDRHHKTIEKMDEWHEKAYENVDEWGQQTVETLLLAIQEELGELTQANLEHRSEGQSYGRMYDELDDLAPLLIQLWWSLNSGNIDSERDPQ